MKVLALILISLFFISCSSKQKVSSKTDKATKADVQSTQSATATDTLNCKNKSDERTLVIEKEGNGCALQYSKFGSTNKIATSVNGNTHCKTVFNRIKDNLKNAGFACN